MSSGDEDMDYGFEYSEEEVEEEDVDIENHYYNSKGLLESMDGPAEALKGFLEVVKMEEEKGEWGFKALKKIVQLQYKTGDRDATLKYYRDMLSYVKCVTRNQSEKKLNSLLDFVSQSTDTALLQDFYTATLEALAESKNERLWFKTQLKLCALWFKLKEYQRGKSILRQLHQSCMGDDGSDDVKKGTQLLEVYALEIQMYTEQKDTKKLKELYHNALNVKSAIPHPRILGIIRECGGKMHMHERVWSEAATDFFEAFKNYDEAGNARRVQCLKYLTLAYMLMESSVDPFDAQEAKPYRQDPEVLAMTNLVEAYQRNDITSFERILRTNRRSIYDDPFIRTYLDDLLKNIRTQVLLQLIKPYTCIRLPSIASQLNIPESDVEQLLVSLILDNRVIGRIDQVNKLLKMGDEADASNRYVAFEKWAGQLRNLQMTSMNKLLT